MRKLWIPVISAGMLLPAAAYAQDNGFVRAMRGQVERSAQPNDGKDDGGERSQSARAKRPKVERRAPSDRAPRDQAPAASGRDHRGNWAEAGDRDAPPESARHGRQFDRQADRRRTNSAPPEDRQERRPEGLAGGFSQVGRDMADGRTHDRDDSRDGRRDRDPRHDWRDGRSGRHHWDRDWRRDRRYDWSGYRSRYGSLYRLGHYYDPYGWGYRRFSIGFNLWPSYYRSNYWLDDPWMYRLPPAYGPYRWVRYYDDALLVDIYTGQVVDVIHAVFW